MSELIARLSAKERENAEKIVEAERKSLRNAAISRLEIVRGVSTDSTAIHEAIFDRDMRSYLASYLARGRPLQSNTDELLQSIWVYFVPNKRNDLLFEMTQDVVVELALRGLQPPIGPDAVKVILNKEGSEIKKGHDERLRMLFDDIDRMEAAEEGGEAEEVVEDVRDGDWTPK